MSKPNFPFFSVTNVSQNTKVVNEFFVLFLKKYLHDKPNKKCNFFLYMFSPETFF